MFVLIIEVNERKEAFGPYSTTEQAEHIAAAASAKLGNIKADILPLHTTGYVMTFSL